MELCDIDVEIEDEDMTMILLASLPPSYENFVSSFSVWKDSITLKEVKSGFYSRELWLKASRMVMKPLCSNYRWLIRLKGRTKRKAKVARREKQIQRAYIIIAKNLFIGRKISQREQRKILLLLWFRMIPHQKTIWF